MSLADQYLSSDGTYSTARATDQSGQRGWDFTPTTRRPVRWGFWIITAVQAVVVFGALGLLAFVFSIIGA